MNGRPKSTPAQIIAVGLLSAVLVTLVVLLVFAFKNNAHNRQQDLDARLTSFTNCIKSGNALRHQMRAEFVDVKRSVLIPVFDGVALTIPGDDEPVAPADVVPGETSSKSILLGAVAYMRQRIKTIGERIPNADCLDLYPPLDGQRYPLDLVRRVEALRDNTSG